MPPTEGAGQHAAALEIARHRGTAEVIIAALEDLAELSLDAGDTGGAQARLAEAAALLRGDLVFGWRLNLKHRLITGRLALQRGDPGQAAAQAGELESRAKRTSVSPGTSAWPVCSAIARTWRWDGRWTPAP